MNRLAYVTITIPVDLESDTPVQRVDWWNNAALENLLVHPAMTDREYLGMYVDDIKWEEREL